MKFIRATKDYQIKVLASLPTQFNQFVAKSPDCWIKMHSSENCSDFPLFSASSNSQTLICSAQYCELLETAIFGNNRPTSVEFSAQNEPIACTQDGYFLTYKLNLQADPEVSFPIRHFQHVLAQHESVVYNCTSHRRALFSDGSLLFFPVQQNLARSCLERARAFLIGADSDCFAQTPLPAKTPRTKPERRNLKDSRVDFDQFQEEELQQKAGDYYAEKVSVQLPEGKVTIGHGAALIGRTVYLLNERLVRTKIDLQSTFDGLGFQFIEFGEFAQFRPQALEAAPYYVLALDCACMSPSGGFAVLCAMFAREAPEKLKLVILSAEGAEVSVYANSVANSAQISHSRFSEEETDVFGQINAFYDDFPIKKERFLYLCSNNYEPKMLYCQSISGFYYICYDDEIHFFKRTMASCDLSVNGVDFYTIVKKIEAIKEELDRKRYCGRIAPGFRRLVGRVYNKQRLFGGIPEQEAMPMLEQLGFKLLNHKKCQISFILTQNERISFAEFRPKMKSENKSVNLSMLSKSVRFSEANSILKSQVVNEELPISTGFTLFSYYMINNSPLLKNTISSQVSCLLKQKQRYLLVCCGINNYGQIQLKMAENNSTSLVKTILKIQGGQKVLQETLELNFDNYLRNQALIPMDLQQVQYPDIILLLSNIMNRSLISHKDYRWIGQRVETLAQHQLAVNQLIEANFQKKQQILLLINYLRELQILQNDELTEALPQIRTAFDCCTGVTAILQCISDGGDEQSVLEIENEICSQYKQVQVELEHQRNQQLLALANQLRLQKLTDFEAAMSALELHQNEFILNTIFDIYSIQGNDYFCHILAYYISEIQRERIENAEGLLIESQNDFPDWLLQCLERAENAFFKCENVEYRAELADAILMLKYQNSSNFVEDRERTLSVFDGLTLSAKQCEILARICCKYHDFHRFARFAAATLRDLTFDEFYRIQLYLEEYKDMFAILSDYLSVEILSQCEFENFDYKKEYFLPEGLLEMLLQVQKEMFLFTKLEPCKEAFDELMYAFYDKKLTVRALVLAIVTGKEDQFNDNNWNSDMQELRARAQLNE